MTVFICIDLFNRFSLFHGSNKELPIKPGTIKNKCTHYNYTAAYDNILKLNK